MSNSRTTHMTLRTLFLAIFTSEEGIHNLWFMLPKLNKTVGSHGPESLTGNV